MGAVCACGDGDSQANQTGVKMGKLQTKQKEETKQTVTVKTTVIDDEGSSPVLRSQTDHRNGLTETQETQQTSRTDRRPTTLAKEDSEDEKKQEKDDEKKEDLDLNQNEDDKSKDATPDPEEAKKTPAERLHDAMQQRYGPLFAAFKTVNKEEFINVTQSNEKEQASYIDKIRAQLTTYLKSKPEALDQTLSSQLKF